jgi:signal transduction histidine kinase
MAAAPSTERGEPRTEMAAAELMGVAEMLANAEKHARASVVEVSAEAADGMLRVRVRDDGIGGADPVRGSGLLGLKDRIEALGGTFSVHSPLGRGTTVICEVPVTADSC